VPAMERKGVGGGGGGEDERLGHVFLAEVQIGKLWGCSCLSLRCTALEISQYLQEGLVGPLRPVLALKRQRLCRQ